MKEVVLLLASCACALSLFANDDGKLSCPAGADSVSFSPLVPVMLRAETTELLVKDITRMREEFGFRRFILVGPASGRLFGRADLACFERIGRKIAAIKEAFARADVQIGWWRDPTFHAADGEPWQRIMDCDGHVADSICPLDEGHAADFAAKLCTGLRIARPDPKSRAFAFAVPDIRISFMIDDYSTTCTRPEDKIGACRSTGGGSRRCGGCVTNLGLPWGTTPLTENFAAVW